MTPPDDKPLARNIGEFFGHIFKAFKGTPEQDKTVVKHETEEEDRGDMILRRTTIEEIEFKDGGKSD